MPPRYLSQRREHLASRLKPALSLLDASGDCFQRGALRRKIIGAATGRPKCPTRNIQTGEVDPQTQAHQPAPG
jgi:hypothetical protein